MKIIGILCWYEESPSWLSAVVTSAAKLCDHIVAVDGAYFLFPNGRATSGPEQHQALQEAAYAAGVGITIHTPNTVWYGNEIEKRDTAFRLASLSVVDESKDWYFVIDGDEVVRHIDPEARKLLEETDLEAAEVTLWKRNLPDQEPGLERLMRAFEFPREEGSKFRMFFRAHKELRVIGTHDSYVVKDDSRELGWRFLWGREGFTDIEPGLDLTRQIVVEHREHWRDRARHTQKRQYYKTRDENHFEELRTEEFKGAK